MIGRMALVVLGLAMALGSSAASNIENREIAAGQFSGLVRVESALRSGDTVRVRLVNLSPSERLENIRLLVTESFRWTDERHPGTDDPSRATPVTVAQIGPGATFEASFAIPPPPARTDGSYVLGATVSSLDKYPAP